MLINTNLNDDKQALADEIEYNQKLYECAAVLNCEQDEVEMMLGVLHHKILRCNEILNPKVEH